VYATVFTIDFTPVIIAPVLSTSERMHRDTEGIV